GTAFAGAPLRGQRHAAFSDYDPAFRIDSQMSTPRIRCFDLRELTTLHTPASRFYIFHQGSAAPAVDLSKWRLVVGGAVARPRVLTFEDLLRLERKEIDAVIE